MRKLTHSEFLRKVPAKIIESFEFLSEYDGDSKKIKMLGSDGGIYMCSPTHIKLGKIPLLRSALNKNELLLNKFHSIHGEKYSYDLSGYKNTLSEITITCKKHGDFKQLIKSHLVGSGCHKCKNEAIGIRKRFTKEYFIQHCMDVHDGKYTYPNFNRANMYSTIDIVCPIHGYFKKVARDHYNGAGCGECNKELDGCGYTKTKWIELGNKSKKFDSFKVYIIAINGNGESFIKIGRTFRTIKHRFRGSARLPDCYKIEPIYTLSGDGSYIYDLEYKLHRMLIGHKYKPLIHFDGEYECFSIDCIDIINNTVNNDWL